MDDRKDTNETFLDIINSTTSASLFEVTRTDTEVVNELHKTLSQVQYIVCPTLVVIGLIGNVCTILTVSRPQFRKLTTRRILCALAVSDSLMLFINPFNQEFMIDLWEQDVRALSTFGCKLFFVMYRAGKFSGSWCIVLVTVERFVAVLFPLKVRYLMSQRAVIISICIVYLVSFTVAISWTFSTGITNGICSPDLVTADTAKAHKAFVVLGAFVYSIGPVIIMLTLVPPIVYRLIKSHRRRRKMSQNSFERSIRDTSKVSIMLIAITLEYIILVTPITLVLIITLWNNKPIFGNSNPDNVILQSLALIFEQLNHSINFFVYVLCSRQFRKRFVDMICCRKNSRTDRFRATVRLSQMIQENRDSATEC